MFYKSSKIFCESIYILFQVSDTYFKNIVPSLNAWSSVPTAILEARLNCRYFLLPFWLLTISWFKALGTPVEKFRLHIVKVFGICSDLWNDPWRRIRWIFSIFWLMKISVTHASTAAGDILMWPKRHRELRKRMPPVSSKLNSAN